MQSRTSFFNGAVFRKNLTRFAPVMALDTLLLVIMIMLAWSRPGENRGYYFIDQVSHLISLMGYVNLIYGAVVAQLIFGDLFNSRMCNALHAMPLRRECWFVTNAASGLVYSLIPTAVATLVLLPLLTKTIFAGAWKLAFLFFLAANLEFICLFGLAVFSVMMVGSRITMVAGYGLLNFGAPICYWLVDSVYSPLLYGVITPTGLAEKLFPLQYMMYSFVDTDSSDIFDSFGRILTDVQATYSLNERWRSLWWLALAGIVFTLAALILYKHRSLECAGDAVCSRKLIPVFQVLSALFVAVAAEFFLTELVGLGDNQEILKYVLLFIGLLVGWFAGKMLVERSARVFQPRSFVGLGILAAVLAASMGLTKLDVLHLDERLPAQEDIESVDLSYSDATFTDSSDIAKVLQLNKLVLEDRLPFNQGYAFVLENGDYVSMQDSQAAYWQEGDPIPQVRLRDDLILGYTLKDGRVIRRKYSFWVDSQQGQIAKSLLSRWETVSTRYTYVDGEKKETLPLLLNEVDDFYCSLGSSRNRDFTREQAESLIQAIQADCLAETMAQRSQYHDGVFKYLNYEGTPSEDESVYLSISGENYGWSITVYPDSANTVRWLRDNGYLDGVTIGHRSSPRWY